MNYKHLLLLLVGLLIGQASTAQKLLRPYLTFSHKKVAYITLKDGTEIQGFIKGIDRKKGLIEEIKVKDLAGNKKKYHPDEIAHMYLPPSGFAKFAVTYEVMSDVRVWDNPELTRSYIDMGYVYFEHADVKIKKETRSLLMQLLNPTFSSKVKVYHDPRAKETTSVGFGKEPIEESIAKSYFIKTGESVVYKLRKKDYIEQFPIIFQDCASMLQKHEKPNWLDLEEHIYEYSQQCEQEKKVDDQN